MDPNLERRRNQLDFHQEFKEFKNITETRHELMGKDVGHLLLQYGILSQKYEHLHHEKNRHQEEDDLRFEGIHKVIHGNGNAPGLKSTVETLTGLPKAVKDQGDSTRAMFTIMITSQLAVFAAVITLAVNMANHP